MVFELTDKLQSSSRGASTKDLPLVNLYLFVGKYFGANRLRLLFSAVCLNKVAEIVDEENDRNN